MTDDLSAPPGRLILQDGVALAYRRVEGDGPGVLWLGGFKSDMTGTKAQALAEWAAREGRAYLRFDYFAHGESEGRWEDAVIGRWRADALAVLDALTEGPQVLVGSSMGGWIALLAALARPERIKALVLIAPAPDFTEELMWKTFPFHVREAIEKEGRWAQPSDYGEPYLITKSLIEEGRDWLLLDRPIPIEVPVRILQGWADQDVPWSHAMRLFEALQSADVQIRINKAGDHRLSEPADLARLIAAVDELSV